MNSNHIHQEYFNNPKQHIPHGVYCYNVAACIFWDVDVTKPDQFNGYCHFLKQGDWERNKEMNDNSFIIHGKDKGKSVSEVIGEDFPSSLLWDQCKECGLKEESLRMWWERRRYRK